MITDEVYEHMVYDGAAHQSVARFPELAARSVRDLELRQDLSRHRLEGRLRRRRRRALTAEFRKVHQFNVFTVNTPMQHGLARYMADPAPYLELPAFYQRKRDLFRDGLAAHRAARCCRARARYFQCVDYSGDQRPAPKPTSAAG